MTRKIPSDSKSALGLGKPSTGLTISSREMNTYPSPIQPRCTSYKSSGRAPAEFGSGHSPHQIHVGSSATANPQRDKSPTQAHGRPSKFPGSSDKMTDGAGK
jgi:hypothetical protein